MSKTTNHLNKYSQTTLETKLRSIKVRQSFGEAALRNTLSQMEVAESAIQPLAGWRKLPVLVSAFAVLALLIAGGGWAILGNRNSGIVTTQTQPNGSVDNAAKTQLLDAQTDSSVANEDTAAIQTANSSIDTATNVGNTINENQF